MAFCLPGHLNPVSSDTNDMLQSDFHGAGLLPPPVPGLVLLGACAHCAPLQPIAHCFMAL